VRTVPPVAAHPGAEPPVPDEGAPYVELADLEQCAGLVLARHRSATWPHR